MLYILPGMQQLRDWNVYVIALHTRGGWCINVWGGTPLA